MSLYRATTPKHTFVFDMDPEECFKTLLASYEQAGAVVLEKGMDDMTFACEQDEDGNLLYTATITLSQAETNLFLVNRKSSVYLQLRAITKEDEALISDVYVFEVQRALNDEVLP